MSQKIAIIKQMLHKVHSICSPHLVAKNLDVIRDLLRENDYPIGLINRFLHNSNNKDSVDGCKGPNVDAKNSPSYFRVPYHTSLAPQVRQIFKNTNAKPAFYNIKSSKVFYGRVKDPVPINNQSGVVYQIGCSCNQKYIGQTKQLLKNRVRQHQNDVKNNSQSTGLSNHVIETGHRINWDSVKVIDRETIDYKRQFLEMSHIVTADDSLNIKFDFNSFNNTYQSVLKKFK